VRYLPTDDKFYKVLKSQIERYGKKEGIAPYEYLAGKLGLGSNGDKQLHQKLDPFSTRSLYVDELFIILDELGELSANVLEYMVNRLDVEDEDSTGSILDSYLHMSSDNGFLTQNFYDFWLDKKLDEKELNILLKAIHAQNESLMEFKKKILYAFDERVGFESDS